MRAWINPETGEVFEIYTMCNISNIRKANIEKLKNSIIVLDDMAEHSKN